MLCVCVDVAVNALKSFENGMSILVAVVIHFLHKKTSARFSHNSLALAKYHFLSVIAVSNEFGNLMATMCVCASASHKTKTYYGIIYDSVSTFSCC